jgi:hypothetical protein
VRSSHTTPALALKQAWPPDLKNFVSRPVSPQDELV